MNSSRCSVSFLALLLGLSACSSSSDDATTAPPADGGPDGDVAQLASDGGDVPEASSSTDSSASSRVTLLADGTPYAVDTTQVRLDETSPTQLGYDIGERLDLGAGAGRVTYNGFRGNATPAYSLIAALPGAKKGDQLFFSTSGSFDTSPDATRTIHDALTDVHIKFTASALQDGTVSHTFDVTIKDLDMK